MAAKSLFANAKGITLARLVASTKALPEDASGVLRVDTPGRSKYVDPSLEYSKPEFDVRILIFN